MSSKNKFLKKSLCVVGSSVATAGSLFSAAGVEATGNAALEKQLKEVLSKNFWYVILNFLNIGGLFSDKIKGIENKTTVSLIKKILSEKFTCTKEMKIEATLPGKGGSFKTYTLKKIRIPETQTGIIGSGLHNKKSKVKKYFEVEIDGFFNSSGNEYGYYWDKKSGDCVLLKIEVAFDGKEYYLKGHELRRFNEKNINLEDAKKFYYSLIDICYEKNYDKICKEFCNFLRSDIDNQKFFKRNEERIVKENTEEDFYFDLNFECWINRKKISCVFIGVKGEKVSDIALLYNFGKKGSNGRYRVEENGLSKGEMAMYLENIMEQVRKYKQEKKSTQLVDDIENNADTNN